MAPPPPPNKPKPLPSFLFSQGKSTSSIPKTPSSPKLYQSSPSQWPPSMRSWVDRCFSSCNTTIERDLMEKKLKGHISDSLIKSCGSLSSINWASEPLINVKTSIEPMESPLDLKSSIKPSNAWNNPINISNLPKIPKKILSPNEARAKRFSTSSITNSTPKSLSSFESLENMKALRDENIFIDKDSIIGSSQNLEKPYLRLTSAPDPSTVRPLPVLRKSLDWLTNMIIRDSVDSLMTNEKYQYICDQFKSLRQDLTVQGIKSAFTVKVYESHAKISILHGDLGQFNQCQGQLMELYNLFPSEFVKDFRSYRLLYLLGTRNELELVSFLKEGHELLPYIYELKRDFIVGNSLGFMMHYQKIDQYSKNILMFLGVVERIRKLALISLCRSFRPSLPLFALENYLSLGLKSSNILDWLIEIGAIIDGNSNTLDCKENLQRIML